MEADEREDRYENGRGVQAIGEGFVIAQVVATTKNIFNKPEDRPDQDEGAGDVDRGEEEWPMGVAGQGDVSQFCFENHNEPHAGDDEEAETSELQAQTDQEYIFPQVDFTRGRCTGKHAAADALDKEGNDVEGDEQRRDPSGGKPEETSRLILFWRDPQHHPSEGLVTGGCHDCRRHQQQDCLQDKRSLLGRVVDGADAENISQNLH